jgi:glutaredoxin
VSEYRIVSAPGCNYCTRAKALLTVEGKSFVEEMLSTAEERAAFKGLGFATVPQIWHRESHIGGFEELKKYLS